MREDLPESWVQSKLEEVIDVLDNQRIPVNNKERQERLSGAARTYPYYGATGQVGEIDDYIFEGQSVLLGEDGAPFLEPNKAKAYLVSGRYWVNNHAHILRGNGAVENAFLCHQLNVLDYRKYVSGTTRLKLTQASLRDLRIKLPPLNEQRRIVEKIETLFARLDQGETALRHTQTLLTRYRQSVLKAAVTGALTADWRAANAHRLEHGRDLLARILQTRRETWQGRGKYKEPAAPDTTGLPELPEGWVWASLAQLTSIKGGVTVDKKREATDPLTVPYLRVANVQNGYLDLAQVKEIAVDREKIEQFLLKPGDILLNEGGDRDKLGRGWVWGGEISPCIHQNHVFRARPLLPEMSSKFVSYYANAFGQPFFMRKGKQSVNLASISLTAISGLPVPLPPIDEQQEIVAALEARLHDLAAVVDAAETELTRSAALRQSILKDAFAGKLVPQDPSDEPAAELLARIRASRSAAPKKARGKAHA